MARLVARMGLAGLVGLGTYARTWPGRATGREPNEKTFSTMRSVWRAESDCKMPILRKMAVR